jgi:sialate O-acetylesterase
MYIFTLLLVRTSTLSSMLSIPRLKLLTYSLALGLAVSAQAETVTFGAGNWAAQGVNDNVSKTETATVTQAGVTFELTISLPSDKVGVDTQGELNVDDRNTWRDSDDAFTFSIAVTSGTVETLNFNTILVGGLNQPGEQVTITESATANSRNFNDSYQSGITADDLYTGADALTALTESNTDTWNLTVDNTGDNSLTGIVSLSFDFTLGGDVSIPEISSTVSEIHESGSAVVGVTFDKEVTGLELADFTVLGGTADSLNGSGSNYALTVSSTAVAGGVLSVYLPEGQVTPGNVISNSIDLSIVTGAPVPTLAAGDTQVAEDSSIDVDVSFDVPVSGLGLGDFSVLRGSVVGISGQNDNYTITLEPSGEPGEIMQITLPQDVTVPENVESNVLQVGISASGSGGGGIQLSPVWASNMVLQRDKVLPIAGTAFPGETITVSFRTQTKVTTADDEGNFLIHLDPESASADSDNLILSGSVSTNTRNLRAYVGEVWMCAGQSNMADSFSNPPPAVEAEYQAWLDNGKFTRFFFSSRGSGWKQIEDANRNVVSRTAFYFGMELYKTLNPDPNNLTVPVGVIISANGGTPIQSWLPAEDAEVIRQELGIPSSWNDWENKDYRNPGEQWLDKMDHIPPYAIRGATWYQGERNAKSEMGYEYDRLLEHHVETWRRIWAERGGLPIENFPFYYIEMSHRHERSDYEFPWLRDRLRRANEMIPNGLMAHYIDGGPDLHPDNKQLAGQRLALLARRDIYGEPNLVAQGPLLDAVTPVGNKLVLTFTQVNGGLQSLTDPSGGSLDYFEVAGADGVYYDASAQIVGDTVEVSNLNVPNPLHVRYLFLVPPTQPEPYYSLKNAEGIPAATIISDDDFRPSGRTGGLTPAQYNDKLKAEGLGYVNRIVNGTGNSHFRYEYQHDDTVDQVSIRFYTSDDLITWTEVATSNVDPSYDGGNGGAPPANTNEGAHGNWIHSLSGSEGDRYRDVVIQDPESVEVGGTRFYKIEVTP